MDKLFKGALLALGGAVIGAAAALLLTPTTGEQVREDLSGMAEEARKKARDCYDRVKQNLAEAEEKPEAEPAQEA